MPKSKNDDEPVSTNVEDPADPADPEVPADPADPVELAPTPGKAPKSVEPVDDPVRELLRVNRQEIERLSRQNRKLRERVRKSHEKGLLTPSSDPSTLKAELPPEPSLWNLITGE